MRLVRADAAAARSGVLVSPRPRKAPSAAEQTRLTGRPSARTLAYARALVKRGDPRLAPINPTQWGAVAGLPTMVDPRRPAINPMRRVRYAKAAASLFRPAADSRAIVEDDDSRRAREAANVMVNSSEAAATAPRAYWLPMRPTHAVSINERIGSIKAEATAGSAICHQRDAKRSTVRARMCSGLIQSLSGGFTCATSLFSAANDEVGIVARAHGGGAGGEACEVQSKG